MQNKRTFGLGFDPARDRWYVILNANLDKTSKWNPASAGDTSGTGIDASWLLLFTYTAIDSNNYKYIVTSRGQQYIVQSRADLKFYNINNVKVADSDNQSSRDLIQFTTLNFKPGSEEVFSWSPDDENYGEIWISGETGEKYTPNSYDPGVSLRTRNLK